MSDETRYFIAVAAGVGQDGIYGIGTSAEEALNEAYTEGNIPRPYITTDEDDDGETVYVVMDEHGIEGLRTLHREEAEEELEELGFRVQECTQRLYERVRDHGYDATGPGYRWGGSPADIIKD